MLQSFLDLQYNCNIRKRTMARRGMERAAFNLCASQMISLRREHSRIGNLYLCNPPIYLYSISEHSRNVKKHEMVENVLVLNVKYTM